MTIGSMKKAHRILVADIDDKAILGMVLMSNFGFQLNLRQGLLKMGSEDIVLNHRESRTAKAILAADTEIDGGSEAFVEVQLDGDLPQGSTFMVEPGNSDTEIGRGVMVAKQFSVVNGRIPVRVNNVNLHSVKLRKGTTVGDGVGVSMVQHLISAIHHKPPKKVPKVLASVIADTSQGRREDQKKKIRNFFQQYADVFDIGNGETERNSIVRHKIDTGDAKPMRQMARRFRLAKREVEQILNETQEGVIDP